MSPAVPSLRPVGLGVVLAGLLAGGAALVPADDPADHPADRSVRSSAAADRTGPIAVLRTWDDERAAAWRAGDLRALDRLYAPGSRTGRADRTMLRAWLDRGLRVTGLRMQVAAAQVQRADDRRLVLQVTDRVSAGAAAVRPGVDWPLPRDRWTTRRVVLVRVGERWRVAEVTGQARPVATTAETSGSENS